MDLKNVLLSLFLLNLSTTLFANDVVSIEFKNPSIRCAEAKKDIDNAFSPAGYFSPVEDYNDSIRFTYGIIDGACQNQKYVPFTNGTLYYRSGSTSSNIGLFSGLKTKDLVSIYDVTFSYLNIGNEINDMEEHPPGNIVIFHNPQKVNYNFICYDEAADQLFKGNVSCDKDSTGSPRIGKKVSTHLYSVYINKKTLIKLIDKKEKAVITYRIPTNETITYNQRTIWTANMVITVKKDQNNNFIVEL